MKCPNCGFDVTSEPYDIGDGPELNCPSCDFCWGVNGQPLTDKPIERALAATKAALPADHWMNDPDVVTHRLI